MHIYIHISENHIFRAWHSSGCQASHAPSLDHASPGWNLDWLHSRRRRCWGFAEEWHHCHGFLRLQRPCCADPEREVLRRLRRDSNCQGQHEMVPRHGHDGRCPEGGWERRPGALQLQEYCAQIGGGLRIGAVFSDWRGAWHSDESHSHHSGDVRFWFGSSWRQTHMLQLADPDAAPVLALKGCWPGGCPRPSGAFGEDAAQCGHVPVWVRSLCSHQRRELSGPGFQVHCAFSFLFKQSCKALMRLNSPFV